MQDDGPKKPRLVTKDELNLVENSFSLPGHRHPRGKTTIEVHEEAHDATGRPIERSWVVSAGHYGLPLAADEEIYLALVHLLHLDGFSERAVHFTQYSLLKILGWGDGRWAYERLELGLARLLGTAIKTRNSFWDHKAKVFATHSFSILSSYMLFTRADTLEDTPYVSSATFNEVLFESFKSGFIKTLDFDLYLSLRSPVARKLFRILDKRLHKGTLCSFDVLRLAQRIALSDSAYPSDAKKHLIAAHDDLFEIGLLKTTRFAKVGKTLMVHYEMAPRDEWRTTETRPKMPLRQQENPLARELVQRGITRETAIALVDQHGEKRVADKLEVFDHLVSTNSPQISKNPAGFLRQSIEKDFAPPHGYVSRMERKQRQLADADARRGAEVAAQHEAEEREQFRAKMDALWDTLPEADRASVEREALSKMPAFAVKNYHREQAEGRTSSGYHTWRMERDRLLIARSMTTPERVSTEASSCSGGD